MLVLQLASADRHRSVAAMAVSLGSVRKVYGPSHGGVQARAGCRVEVDSGEMEPLEVAAEVFGSDATIAAQESLEALMAAVHRLDVQFTRTLSPAD